MSETETKPTYTIATPDVDNITQWTNLLNNSFNKVQLLRITDTLSPLFQKYNIVQKWMRREENINTLFDNINGKSSSKKSDVVNLLARILADPINRSVYFNTFPDEIKEVWKYVDKNYYISTQQYYRITGKSCILSEERSYYYGYAVDQNFVAETGWFTTSVSGGWHRKETVFSLSPSFRKLLLSYFHDKSYISDSLIEQLPDDDKLIVFNGEKDLINMMPVLQNLFMNDTLQMGKMKLPSATVKNVSNILNLKEFFSDSTDKEDLNLRARMTLTLFTLYCMNTLMRSNESALLLRSEEMVREIMPHAMNYTHHFVNLIIPMLSKVLTSFTQFSYTTPIIKGIQAILTSLRDDERWMTYQGLEERLRAREVNEMLCIFVNPKLMEDITNERSDKRVTHSSIYRQVGKPFIQGVIFAFASLGILEIAYTQPTNKAPSPYEGLQYLRLTPLGRYALNIDDNYSGAGQINSIEYFEVSDDKLLVRSLQEINPYESILKDMANPIGNHRYVVTNSSFLRNCNTISSIKHKIDTFKQFIVKKPPRNWEDFFKSLLDNTGKITKSVDVYSVFEIDPSDLYLHEILATDPVIREFTRRAENYTLLIESGKFLLFRERLKTYGYLV